MKKLYIEGETFETAFAPLNKEGRPGVDISVVFKEVPDSLDKNLIKKEDDLWGAKVEEAKAKGQEIGKGPQYGITPSTIGDKLLVPEEKKIIIPAAKITYSRIELAKQENQKNIPNVLAISEIIKGDNGYLFVERGGKVAYYGGSSQLHALVAGNYPRNIEFSNPDNMTVEKWLEAQQETEHGLKPEEVYNKQFLGIILDRKLGYKPDIIFTADSSVNKDELSKRHPSDAWEKRGVREFPIKPEELIKVILEHSGSDRHVPPGFGGAILELARIGGTDALNRLQYESTCRGAPEIDYRFIE